MPLQKAKPLKLSALKHVLKKAEVSSDAIANVNKLMSNVEDNGENFLTTILLSNQLDILPKLYRSPYFSIKLSQAGFETNPAVTNADKPSAFYYASAKAENKYVRILYDYAANCRYLFEGTVRDPNDTVLDSLKMLNDVITNDKAKIPAGDSGKDIMEQSLNAITRFNEYQQSIAAEILKFKKELDKIPSQVQLMSARKEFVCNILEIYLTFFYYDVPNLNTAEIYQNYISFYDYYEMIDSFTCLSFFDSIHQLKKEFQLKDENVYAKIESTFILLIQSNREFPKYNHIKCSAEYCDPKCEFDKNILLFISLLHREALQKNIRDFLVTLSQHDQSPVQRNKITDKNLRGTLSSYPDIIDEFLIYRIRVYLKAADEVSFQTDGIRGILVVERALQVLGESIKHRTIENCVVSFLLGCRIPLKLIENLSRIRNILSHYHDSSATGRLELESKSNIFQDLQKELKQIRKSFEIVAFTQHSRLERFLIENCKTELIKLNLDEETRENFIKVSKERSEGEKYSEYFTECIILSFNITNYLTEKVDYEKNRNSNSELLNIEDILNSIQYVFVFLCRYISENIFQPYLQEVQVFNVQYRNDKNIDSLICSISCFLKKYKHEMKQQLKIQDILNSSLKFESLELFFNSLKQNDMSAYKIDVVVEAIKGAYSEATNAKDELLKQIDLGSITLSEKEEKLLKKLIITSNKLKKLKKYFKENDKKRALKELQNEWIPFESIESTLKNMLTKYSNTEVETLPQKSSVEDEMIKTLLIKMVFQRKLKSDIYTSVSLPENICDEFEKFVMKKADFLLSRIENMKSVLIDDDDGIAEAWGWGRSVEIKQHMKYLMRQRFLREISVRSSLEMAFFDCLNILGKKVFAEIYEKFNNLFAGINLRHVLAHGNCVLEIVGGLLDEDDFPSELINKILELIDDAETIISMKKLISISDTLELECFQSWIEHNTDNETYEKIIKKVTRCPRWKEYLFLLPLT